MIQKYLHQVPAINPTPNKMGSTASICCESNIYISYDTRDVGYKRIQTVCEQLTNQKIFREKYNVVYSEIAFCDQTSRRSYKEIAQHLDLIMAKSSCVIICISAYTVQSYYQSIEIECAMNSGKEIIYIISDEKFSPKHNPEIRTVVKNSRWKPLYDEKMRDELVVDILLAY